MGNRPFAMDMRDEIRDRNFRPIRDGQKEARRVTCWWNARVGLFAHATASALDGRALDGSWRAFQDATAKQAWHHAVVNRFAYVQIKKIGGGGRCDVKSMREFARLSAGALRRQIALYRPHLVLGCGVPPASPAELLHEYIYSNTPARRTAATGVTWWPLGESAAPVAMVQLYHPSCRGPRQRLYADVWKSVHEVAQVVGLIRSPAMHISQSPRFQIGGS